jgi:transposase
LVHQATTTIAPYGDYEASPETGEQEADGTDHPVAPRPAHGHSKDGCPELKQVLLSLGVSGDDGSLLRLGIRDGNTTDSVETPLAIEECLARGLTD